MKIIIPILLLITLPSLLYADFEHIGIGARPTALGGWTAFSDDAYGLYYNPGGPGFADIPEIALEFGRMHLGLKDGSNLSDGYIGYVSPLKNDKGTLGFAWLNFSLVGYYSENRLIFSYSRKLREDLSVGISLKPLYQTYTMDDYTRIDPVFNYGSRNSNMVFGIDQGVLWKFYPDYLAGLSLRNINQPNIGLLTNEQLPMTINLGVAYRRDYKRLNLLNIGIDLGYSDGDFKTHAGVEKWFSKGQWGIRCGFGFGSNQYYDLSAGGSFKFELSQIDYSMTLPMSGIKDTIGTHKISLTYRFGKVETFDLEKYRAERKELQNKIKELEYKLEDATKGTTLDAESLKLKIKELEDKLGVTEKKLNDTQNELNKSERKLNETRQELEIKPGRVTPKPAIKTEPSVRTHTVTSGETLPSIAEKYYGDSGQWKKIYNANKDKIERGQVTPGQVLVIPK